MNDIVDTRIQRLLDIDDAKICNLHHQIIVLLGKSGKT